MLSDITLDGKDVLQVAVVSLRPQMAVGARVYELIDGKRNVGAIVDDIVAEFEVTADEAKTDVFEFLEQLLEIDSVRKVEDAG